jgi:hypothetical protein
MLNASFLEKMKNSKPLIDSIEKILKIKRQLKILKKKGLCPLFVRFDNLIRRTCRYIAAATSVF